MDICGTSQDEIEYDMGSPVIVDRREDYNAIFNDDKPQSFAEKGYFHVVEKLLNGDRVVGADMRVYELEDHLLDIRKYHDLRLFCGEAIMSMYKSNELTDAQRAGVELEAKILAAIVVG